MQKNIRKIKTAVEFAVSAGTLDPQPSESTRITFAFDRILAFFHFKRGFFLKKLSIAKVKGRCAQKNFVLRCRVFKISGV